MTYKKDTEIGGVTTSEYYEGTPQEIIDLMNRMPQDLKDGEWLQGETVSLPSNCHININHEVETSKIIEGVVKRMDDIAKRMRVI